MNIHANETSVNPDLAEVVFWFVDQSAKKRTKMDGKDDGFFVVQRLNLAEPTWFWKFVTFCAINKWELHLEGTRTIVKIPYKWDDGKSIADLVQYVWNIKPRRSAQAPG